MMSTSSLLLLRRCSVIWTRQSRNTMSMIFRRPNGTAIYYVHHGWDTSLRRIYGASDIIFKNTTPPTCIVSSQYDCIVAAIFGFGRYICYQPRVYFIGHYEPSYSSQAYILYVNKILSFITHLHEQYVVHQLPYSLLNYSQRQR